jgi:hypothetical protein
LDRFIGGASNLGENLAGAPREVGIHHEDEILEDDPGAIGRLAIVTVSLPDVNPGRKLTDTVGLRKGPVNQYEGKEEDESGGRRR